MTKYKSTNKIAIFSDLHLGVHQNSELWYDIALDWVQWFTTYIKKQGINTVLFGGDFFHHRNEINVRTLDVANKFLSYLDDFTVIMITGNHCCFYKDNSSVNSLSILNNKHNFVVYDKPTQIQINDRKFFLSPWGTKIEDIKKSDTILGHFEIEGFKFNGFRLCEEGFNATSLLDLAPLTYSGHFHIRDERKYKNGDIVYVGNPFQMDFGDLHHKKGFYIHDLETNTYEFIENSISPIHKRVYLSKYNTKNIKGNIIQFIIDRGEDQKSIEAKISELQLLSPLQFTTDYLYSSTVENSNITIEEISITEIISDYINQIDHPEKSRIKDVFINLYQKYEKS